MYIGGDKVQALAYFYVYICYSFLCKYWSQFRFILFLNNYRKSMIVSIKVLVE